MVLSNNTVEVNNRHNQGDRPGMYIGASIYIWYASLIMETTSIFAALSI